MTGLGKRNGYGDLNVGFRRFLFFWTAIVGTLLVPGWILSSLVQGDGQWVLFFCNTAWWLGHWETTLCLLPPSVLHHVYWLGRRGAPGKNAMATTVAIHAGIVLPLLVSLMVGFQSLDVPGRGQRWAQGLMLVELVYWVLAMALLARLDRLWCLGRAGGHLTMAKRLWLLFVLPAATYVVAYVLLWLNGPCWVTSVV